MLDHVGHQLARTELDVGSVHPQGTPYGGHLGGPGLPEVLDALRANGRHVLAGVVGGQPPEDFGAGLMRNFRRSVSFATFSSDTVPGPDRQAVRAQQFAGAARGELRTVVHDVLPLDRAADAHRAMDAGEVFGRVVLTP